MAYGTVTQRKIQIGAESTAGTAVAATTIWRGPAAQIDPGLDVRRPEENVGLLVDTERNYIPSIMAMLDIPECEATFEQMPYLFEGSIKKIGTGAADGTGTGKIYAYSYDETGGQTLQTYTIEAGDNNQAHEMEYSFPTEWSLKWAARDGLRMSSKWSGKQRTSTTFTGSLSLPTVEEILAPKIYIDDAGGTIGTTQLTGTLVGYELKCSTGLVPVFTGEGVKTFTAVKQTKPSITLRLTYEHDANATTEYGKMAAMTTRLVRILHEGSAVTKGTGAYSYKTARFDMAGRYVSFSPYEDQDGDNQITVELQAGYNVAADLFFSATVVNLLAALA